MSVPISSQSRSPLMESIIHDNIDKILNEVTYLNTKSTAFYDNFFSMVQPSSPPSLSLNIPQNNTDTDATVNSNHDVTDHLEHQVFNIFESIENEYENSNSVAPSTDKLIHAGVNKTISNIVSSLSETTPSQVDQTSSLNDVLAINTSSLDAMTTSLNVMSPSNEATHAGMTQLNARGNERNLLTGNPSFMDKASKEVFTHKQFPESSNKRQKRQMPNPSVGGAWN